MSCKELRRAGILARVEGGELKLVDAAVLMGMSYRQSKRLARRYREGGTEGLKHGSGGRKEHVCELVQMDGSFHNWLEERGPRGCLMNMVDDACGNTLAHMGEEETI